MSFLSALESYVLKYKSQLDRYGLLITKKEEGPGMGAILIISGNSITIRFINDRGQYFIEIGKGDHFFDLGILLAIQTLKEKNRDLYSLTLEEKTLIWELNYDFSDPLKSLIPIMDNVVIFLSENSLESLNSIKEEYYKGRGDWLFKKN